MPDATTGASAKHAFRLWRTLLGYHALLAVMVVILAVIQGNDLGLEPWQWVSVVVFAIISMGACVWIPGLAIFFLMRVMRHPSK